MEVQQFVMAYGAEQDRLRAMLPQGFTSLRPVLRINGEIMDGATGYLEFNTPVEHQGKRGWLNIGHWSDVPFSRNGEEVTFSLPQLTITFTLTGKEGGCPAEKDNDGCFFLEGDTSRFRPTETITSNKTYCHCSFSWTIPGGAQGVSTGETLPAFLVPPQTQYPALELTVKNAALIPCQQVLGAYTVTFQRQ